MKDVSFPKEVVQVIFHPIDCSRCIGEMHEDRHDFAAGEENESEEVKDVLALICNACS